MLIENAGVPRRAAEVDVDGKLATRSVDMNEEVWANRNGDAYNINTGLVNLTDASETPMLYVKNNDTSSRDLIVTGVVFGVFNSANGSSTADVYATFVRNPSDGTIVSGATDVDINSNRNYGSSNTMVADCYKGSTGSTMTGGEDHILVRLSLNSRSFVGINEIIPRGRTMGIKFKPPTSNDGMNVYVAAITYLKAPEGTA